jgi:hypothetical protein
VTNISIRVSGDVCVGQGKGFFTAAEETADHPCLTDLVTHTGDGAQASQAGSAVQTGGLPVWSRCHRIGALARTRNSPRNGALPFHPPMMPARKPRVHF